jgi:uncharacterized protein (TIGR02246 family)
MADPAAATTEATMTAEERALADRLDILELFARYCHAVDSRDPDAVVDCFTEDGLFDSSLTGPHRGRAEIRERIERGRARPPDWQRHFLLNPIIELDGDRATFRAYMLITWIKNDRTTLRATGHYHGTVVRDGDRWRFQERYMVADDPTELRSLS